MPTQVVRRNQFEKKSHAIIAVSMEGKFYAEVVANNQNIDSVRYVEFLKNLNKKFGRYNISLTFDILIFVQDNARPHTSQYIMSFLQEKGINSLKQPAYSPDFNIVDRFVNKYHYVIFPCSLGDMKKINSLMT